MKNLSLFGKRKVTTTILLLMVVMSGMAQTDRQYVRQGNKQYRAGDFANAEVSYRKAIEKNPRNPQAAYNLGNALMAQKKTLLQSSSSRMLPSWKRILCESIGPSIIWVSSVKVTRCMVRLLRPIRMHSG